MKRISAEDIDPYISRAVRGVMLDLVLAWATVDSAIAQLTAAAFALSPSAGAILIEHVSVSNRIGKIIKLNKQLGRHDQIRHLKTLKKQYEAHSKCRNVVAHDACVGVMKSDRNRVVFAAYDVAEVYGELSVIALDVSEFKAAISWARHVQKAVVGMLDAVNFYGAASHEETEFE